MWLSNIFVFQGWGRGEGGVAAKKSQMKERATPWGGAPKNLFKGWTDLKGIEGFLEEEIGFSKETMTNLNVNLKNNKKTTAI